MMRKFALSFAFMLIATYAFAQAATAHDEKIAGFNVSLDQMTFTVWNSGYTDKSSFELEIAEVGTIYEVRLVRIRKDYGKMMPQPMEIIFTHEELKDKLDLRSDIRILNTFSVYNF
jgi:hypothetical protein